MNRSNAHRILDDRLGGVALFYALFASVAFLIRLALLFHSWGEVNRSVLALLGTFFCGFGFDLAAASVATIPLVLLLALTPSRLFAQRWYRASLGIGFFLMLYV